MEVEIADAYQDINIKARCANPEQVQKILLDNDARYLGEDHQTDTFYQVEVGKMKLREGNIENLITHYLREEVAGAWHTKVFVYEKSPSEKRKIELLGCLSKLAQVKKRRKIFFIDNVKFHIDAFENSDCFVEIEAIDKSGMIGLRKIKQQAEYYKQLLSIHENDILTKSYIDIYA